MTRPARSHTVHEGSKPHFFWEHHAEPDTRHAKRNRNWELCVDALKKTAEEHKELWETRWYARSVDFNHRRRGHRITINMDGFITVDRMLDPKNVKVHSTKTVMPDLRYGVHCASSLMYKL
ncbi:hypothetical protein H1O16_gp097 [Burkholderia phage BcepSaruman]|uniref:Uncharacterized protein n=1 Tax=Burkholderia phage BcepSaruman TaxID=2530032 RepID=A0A4D5ZCX1_9CAUD|nr:hypothetical protein H1O16_gp097 [Burkholderia phage BcepSaruman]QBX06510.1 hypothetical protein BcepSaruman_097 [Burkholderia phage BcepSaruman]